MRATAKSYEWNEIFTAVVYAVRYIKLLIVICAVQTYYKVMYRLFLWSPNWWLWVVPCASGSWLLNAGAILDIFWR